MTFKAIWESIAIDFTVDVGSNTSMDVKINYDNSSPIYKYNDQLDDWVRLYPSNVNETKSSL